MKNLITDQLLNIFFQYFSIAALTGCQVSDMYFVVALTGCQVRDMYFWVPGYILQDLISLSKPEDSVTKCLTICLLQDLPKLTNLCKYNVFPSEYC